MKSEKKPATRRRRALPSILVTGFAVLLVPLLLLAAEGILRLRDYGVSPDPFRELEHSPGLYRDNPHYFKKYHPRTGKSDSDLHPHLFRKEKGDRTLRGILLGGSTAAGFPFFKKHGFAEIAAAILNGVQEERRIEILNLGYSAMSSYYVRDLRRTLEDYHADFLVLYTGHNEFYGTISATTGGNRFLKNLYLGLKNWRVFQFLFNLGADPPPRGNLMAAQFADQTIPAGDPLRARAREDFLANLRDVLDHASGLGVPALVLEPVSNYREMPPFGSPDPGAARRAAAAWRDEIAAGREESALAAAEAYHAANGADPYGAYLLARSLDRLGRGDEAWEHYREALEKDPVPFRMPPSTASALEELTRSYPEGAVRYVALERRALHSPGRSFFTNATFVDHLHFNFPGQKWVGKELALAVAGAFPGLGAGEAAIETYAASPGRIEDAVGFMPIFDLLAREEVRKLIGDAPYTLMPWPYVNPDLARAWAGPEFAGNRELVEDLRGGPTGQFLDRYYRYLSRKGDGPRILELARAFVKTNPGSVQPHINLGFYLLGASGEEAREAALEEYLTALQLSEDPDQLLLSLRELLVGKGRRDLLDALTRRWEAIRQ